MSGSSDIFGVGKAVEKGIDAFEKAVGALLGPAAREVGEALADPIRAWRKERQQRAGEIVRHALRLIHIAGAKQQPVSGRILIPILDHGSLEEDADLRTQWAALLASAVDPSTRSQVLPAYPRILAELSGTEVKILDWAYHSHLEAAKESKKPVRLIVHVVEIHHGLLLPISLGDIYVSANNLCRLGLWEHADLTVRKEGVVSLIRRELSGRKSGVYKSKRDLTVFHSDEEYCFSMLGLRFIKACKYGTDTSSS